MRMACWLGFAAVAGAFGGLIAFGVQHAHAAIHNWQILFIIEGIPAILMGLVTIFFLPNRPESTTFFNERERAIALDRMNRGTSSDTGAKVEKAHILMACRDWRCYTGGGFYFCLNTMQASISAFLPTIIATFGFTPAITQLLTVPPYAVAVILMISLSWTSDRLQSRGIFHGHCEYHLWHWLCTSPYRPNQRPCSLLCCLLHRRRLTHDARFNYRLVRA